MIKIDRKLSLIIFKRKLIRKARNMSNEQLRKVLWAVRGHNELLNEFTKESQKSFLIEEVYSEELKKRELLEWALNSKPD
ncbi:MAG: hypothetical protein JXA54_07770 [Candidatus Heimdallarchaeota archaeon]|nr:hypothetical protein [Candidatus Heimdallarchaeota archaeon]